MSIKFIIGAAIAATVIFTGCASKDASTAQSASNSTSNQGSGSAASSTSTVNSPDAASSASAIEGSQSKIKSVQFDFDKFNIKADMQPVVEGNAKTVDSKDVASAKIKLEGNADERGTDEYNYALALKRAESVKSAYSAKGVAVSRISTVSLGEGNPVCKDSNEECWAKNRRVDTKLEK